MHSNLTGAKGQKGLFRCRVCLMQFIQTETHHVCKGMCQLSEQRGICRGLRAPELLQKGNRAGTLSYQPWSFLTEEEGQVGRQQGPKTPTKRLEASPPRSGWGPVGNAVVWGSLGPVTVYLPAVLLVRARSRPWSCPPPSVCQVKQRDTLSPLLGSLQNKRSRTGGVSLGSRLEEGMGSSALSVCPKPWWNEAAGGHYRIKWVYFAWDKDINNCCLERLVVLKHGCKFFEPTSTRGAVYDPSSEPKWAGDLGH